MRRYHQEIGATGAGIVAIGTGDAMYAKDFIRERKIGFLVLLDEDAAAARASEVKRGTKAQLIGPKQLAKGARNFFVGERQGKHGKRISQLGATFVIGPGGTVLFEHRAETADEHAPVSAVLDVLRGAR